MLSSMSSMVSQIGPGFKAAGQMAIDALKNLGKWFYDTVIQPMRDAIDNLSWENIKNGFDTVLTAIGEATIGFFSGFFDMLPDMPAVLTIDWWAELFSGIGITIDEWATALWDMLPDTPEILTKAYWTDLFDFSMPDWDSVFSFTMPEMFTTAYWTDLFSFDLPNWDDVFSFTLPDWLTGIIDFFVGEGAFAGFSIGDRIDFAIGTLPQPFKFILDILNGLVGISIGDIIDFGLDLVGFGWDLLTDPVGTLANVATSLTGFFTNLGSDLAGVLKSPINGLISYINDFFASFSFSKTIDLPGLDPFDIGFDLSDWSIPALAKGGIVNGPTLALLGDNASGREAVVPLEKAGEMGFGGKGNTFNINVNASGITDRTDKRALAREIGNMIQQEMARSIGGSTMRGRY